MSELGAVQAIQMFLPMSGVGRSLPIDRLNLYVRLQYFPEVAPGTPNVLFGTLSRP